jgi:flagellar biogenesis protein FliO
LNDPRQRKRLIWLGGLGAVLVASLVFISLFAPSAHPGDGEPALHPTTVAGAYTTAAAGTRTGATEEGGFHFGGGDALSLVLRLALVAVIIGISIAGLRWWGRRTSGPRSTTGFLRVLDTLAISNGRTIHLVALGERVIAVGATAQQLTLLNELTEDEAARVQTALPPAGADTQLATFATELFHSMRGSARRSQDARRESVIGERP